ncbi:MAG: DUF4956 domain-containing protein [Clostridia bacterium]|nr:DUF4956 domain-containing protein [Clostridia bacterium]
MNDTIFSGLFDTDFTVIVSVSDFLFCLGASLLLGILIAATYSYKTRHTQSFVTTLTLLPAVVCIVIMMVNGNVGAGVAVAGAFSLVRFRSVPGTAREIGMLFLAMGTGLITGMGYIAFAALFTVIMCTAFTVCTLIGGSLSRTIDMYKTLVVTIPEDLNYAGIFDDILDEYTKAHSLIRVKTTNMGSLFKLTYELTMKETAIEKELIDKIRERNGNLEISIMVSGNTENQL